MGDEADNLVLRNLREMRTHMDKRFDEVDVQLVKVEARLSDVEGVTRHTLTEVVALARRVEHLETGLRVAERLDALEKKFVDLEQRLGS